MRQWRGFDLTSGGIIGIFTFLGTAQAADHYHKLREINLIRGGNPS
jgi:hypothetical protein